MKAKQWILGILVLVLSLTLSGCGLKPGADLSGRNLRNRNLKEANLAGANFSGADLYGAKLGGADLSGANLEGVNLEGADLRGANLSKVDLSSLKLSGVLLSAADFSESVLSGQDLSGMDLSNVNFSSAKLDGANLREADLSGSILVDQDLSGMDLSGVDFSEAFLDGVNFSGATLDHANLIGAVGLTEKMLDGAASLNGTQLQTLAQIQEVLSSVCSGKGVPQAAAYTDGAGPIILIGNKGQEVSFSQSLPSGWAPTGIRFTELVACFNEPVTESIETCKYFGGSHIKRLRYRQFVRLVEAKTGETIIKTMLEGNDPRECKSSEDWDLTSLEGDPVQFDQILEFLRPYVE